MTDDLARDEQLKQLETELLQEIPDGTAAGNVSLRTKMAAKGWDDQRYWEIRNRLIDAGVLTTGRGKGGSVRKVAVGKDPVATTGAATASADPKPAAVLATERDLYKPMADVIANAWAKDNRMDGLVVEITALQGARQTGGKWTRPDITAASYRTYPYVPGKHFDLITFEVKPFEGLDVTIVYEALGHRRAATRAYALAHVPDDKRTSVEVLLEDISVEAKRLGVGFIIASDPNNYDTWEELAEAIRSEPDAERMNDFLAMQVSNSFREQLNKWFR